MYDVIYNVTWHIFLRFPTTSRIFFSYFGRLFDQSEITQAPDNSTKKVLIYVSITNLLLLKS